MNDTRGRLLAATRRCVATEGLARTTSRAIAAEADANLGAITYHFGSKDRLVAEALLDGLRSWLAPALEVLGDEGDPSAQATVAIRTLTSTFAEHADDAPTYLQALVEAPRRQDLHEGILELWAELRDRLAHRISELQRQGELGDWVDPEAMSAVLVSVATGLVLQVTLDPDGPPMEAMASQFGALLLTARGS